jgi:prepilin-type N-terminal cleavage/methylation domain-containing protein
MQTRRGFTIVEMVVTLAIMAILLTLTVVSLQASQVNARNAKREADVEAIARGLEVRYKQGNPRATESTGMTNSGQYPGINEWFHVQGFDKGATWNPTIVNGGYRIDEYAGTTESNFKPPTSDSGSGFNIICVWTGCTQPAGNISQITAAMGSNNDNYVYEPVDTSGNPCSNSGCVSFNLYYHREGDPATTYQVVKSEHR